MAVASILFHIIISLLTIIAATYIYKWIYAYVKCMKIINLIPGPPSLPILGNVLEFLGEPERMFQFIRKNARTYPIIFRFWAGPQRVVNILSPDDIEQILSSQKHIEKSIVYNPLLPWLGTGLLTSTGHKWQSRRKILTPAFHFNILQEFYHVFLEQSAKLVERLAPECEKEWTNIVPFITETTLNSICETAMGTRMDIKDKTQREYHKAIIRIGQIILHRLTRIWHFPDLIFMFSSLYFEQRRLITTLHNFSKSVIANRTNYFKTVTKTDASTGGKPKKRLAMLDLLLSAKDAGADIDDDGIREEVDTFMFEGHDTTSMALSFAFLLIACHKNVQDKLYDELRQTFGNSNRIPTYNELQDLQYLDRCLKECLRLYPSVPIISRMLRESITTKSGYNIPKDTVLHVHIFDIHRNPETFPEPERFDPDRFLPEITKDRHPFAYIPFSAGPRNCIGQRFALLEVKTIVTYVLRNYTLDPVDMPEDLTLLPDLVLRSKNGVRVKLRRRIDA